jgi:hypothetical protein
METEAEQISSELSRKPIERFSILSTLVEGRENGLLRAVEMSRKREDIMLTCYELQLRKPV